MFVQKVSSNDTARQHGSTNAAAQWKTSRRIHGARWVPCDVFALFVEMVLVEILCLNRYGVAY